MAAVIRASTVRATYRIGPLLLDAEASVVTHAGVPVALGKRAVAVLAVLVRAAPNYVTKARILEAAWPGVIVEESNLPVQIAAIRRVLASVPGGARWLETLSGRGYRFVGPVTPEPGASSGTALTPGRSNLPAALTRFIGRERELAALREIVGDTRLLTLTGTGGVGKTRLAQSLAHAVADHYRDGVWLVELAALRDAHLVPQAAASALGLKEQPGRDLLATLTQYLRERHLLLVLDNAEHLLGATAQLAEAVLRRCPDVTALVTSRERLGVPGEVTFRVPSLSVPFDDASRGDVLDYEATRLFVERARLHRPAFDVPSADAAALASICRRLDGIPLAIELAAARVRSMSVEEIDARLDGSLALLTGGARTAPLRQQTLRAAIDWSYDLLGPREREMFEAVAVFAGGFTLDAAEHVCSDDALPASDVLDLLASLVDKSLVLAEERGSATRYRLLETLREYAAARLRGSSGAAQRQARHFAYFLALAEEAEGQLKGADQRAWLDCLETEHDNLRAALEGAIFPGANPEAGLRLANAVARFWLVRGYLAEGRNWFSALLAAARDADAALRGKALNWAGILAWKQGDYDAATSAYAQSLAIRQSLGDRAGVGAVLNNQGLLAYERGDYRGARTLHEQSLAIDRELGDRWGVAVSLLHLASMASMQGDYAQARALNEESLAIFRDFRDRAHVANALRNLAYVLVQEDDGERARPLYDESLAICEDLQDRSGIAGALNGLGLLARHAGDASAAEELTAKGLAIYRKLGDREGVARALMNLARVVADRGDWPAARSMQQESLRICQALGERTGIADAIEGLALVAHALGDAAGAVRLCGATERARRDMGAPITPSNRADHASLLARGRASLGDAAFDTAWQAGQEMTLEQAATYALAGMHDVDGKRATASEGLRKLSAQAGLE